MTTLNTRLIHLLDGKVDLALLPAFQPPSSDSVWLASALNANEGDSVLDVGTGCGAVALCALTRIPQLHMTATDCVEDLVSLTTHNATLNGVKINVIEDDIFNTKLKPHSFDHVISNPPFYDRGYKPKAETLNKERAHGSTADDMVLWLNQMMKLVKPSGTVTLIHHSKNADLLLNVTKEYNQHLVHIITSVQRPAKRIILQVRLSEPASLTEYSCKAYDGTVSQAILRQGESIWEHLTLQT